MRDAARIQIVHDLIARRLVDEVIHEPERALLATAGATLCWVLEHDHNESFADTVTELLRDQRAAAERFAAKFGTLEGRHMPTEVELSRPAKPKEQ